MNALVDFEAINRRLMQALDHHVARWLPDGKRDGHEYRALNPTRGDRNIGSFSINLNTGTWADFATDDKGSDPVSLYAYLFTGNDQGRAAKELAAELGMSSGKTEEQSENRSDGRGSLWIPTLPSAGHAVDPPVAHVRRGRPEAVWTYRNEDGTIIGYVCRFRTSDGGKEILPLTWCRNILTGQCEWRWMAQAKPRPLYGLDVLAKKRESTVLIVEGEKCAEAGRIELPEFAVITWPGGSRATAKADWKPLAGRRIIIWPDCDAQLDREGNLLPESRQPGMMAAERVASILTAMDCDVRFVKIPKPGEKPSGWDIADAIAEGMKGESLHEHIMANLGKRNVLPAAGPGEDDSWRRKLFRREGRLIDCRENIYLILKHHPVWRNVLWIDEFSIRLVKRKPAPWDKVERFGEEVEWDHNDDFNLGLWLAQNERLIVRSADNLAAAAGWAASEHKWHPVRQYFEGLEWDRVERLDGWLSSFVGVRDSEYVRAVSRMFMIGMVARICKPGCIMRTMPIFEGKQYQGKSSVLRILGGKWFGDSPIDLNNKDSFQLIQGKMLYEIAELDAFNKAETTRIKSFISSPVDRFRAPYERAPRDWPRQTVFVGTTNQSQYFKDQTGNSRYWPIQVDDAIDIDGLMSTRDQLFAEAVHRFKAGERWHPTRKEHLDMFEPEQHSREIEELWEGLIGKWLDHQKKDRVTATEILLDCLQVEVAKIDGMRSMSMRIGIVMHRLGWMRKREGGKSRGYYYVKAVTPDKEEKRHVPF